MNVQCIVGITYLDNSRHAFQLAIAYPYSFIATYINLYVIEDSLRQWTREQTSWSVWLLH